MQLPPNKIFLDETLVSNSNNPYKLFQDFGVVIAALEGLSAMCALSSGRSRVGQEGGVEGVVKCGGSEERGVRAAAAHTLASLSSESPANCK